MRPCHASHPVRQTAKSPTEQRNVLIFISTLTPATNGMSVSYGEVIARCPFAWEARRQESGPNDWLEKHRDEASVSRLRESVQGRNTRWAAVISKDEAGVTEALSVCCICECVLVNPSRCVAYDGPLHLGRLSTEWKVASRRLPPTCRASGMLSRRPCQERLHLLGESSASTQIGPRSQTSACANRPPSLSHVVLPELALGLYQHSCICKILDVFLLVFLLRKVNINVVHSRQVM